LWSLVMRLREDLGAPYATYEGDYLYVKTIEKS
jgi:hypothetical protein